MLPRIPGFPESRVWPQITLCPMRSKCVSFVGCACPYPCGYWDADSGEAILGHKDQSHTPDGGTTTSESFTGWSWAAIPIRDFQLTDRKFYVFNHSYFDILSHCAKCMHSLIQGVWKLMLQGSTDYKQKNLWSSSISGSCFCSILPHLPGC